MVSERSLGIITLSCITAVALVAAIKINGLNIDITHPLKVTNREVPQYAVYDPLFYETEADTKADSTVKSSPAPVRPSGMPGVTARAYLIGNVDTGDVYAEYNGKRVMPVASMSKLVTAFVATDVIALDMPVEISSSSLMAPPDKSNLQAHERYKLSEILYPLLLNSSNVAAEAISSSTENRAKFLEDMSSYAWEIGMPDTFFADPSGVDPHNAATARDLFALARYLLKYRPDILTLTRTASYNVATTTDHGAHQFTSIHPFVLDPRFVGGKTGRTPEAGETMMTIMNLSGRNVVFIVLGSLNREQDTRVLIKSIE